VDDEDVGEELAISVRLNHVVTPLWDQPYSKQMEVTNALLLVLV